MLQINFKSVFLLISFHKKEKPKYTVYGEENFLVRLENQQKGHIIQVALMVVNSLILLNACTIQYFPKCIGNALMLPEHGLLDLESPFALHKVCFQALVSQIAA